jgi:hypothetical protein
MGAFKTIALGTVTILILMTFALTVQASGNDNGETAASKEKPKRWDDIKHQVDGLMATGQAGNEKGSAYMPDVWCGQINDSETQQICWEAYRAGLRYYSEGLPHRQKVIRWQHLSTRIIFFVVLILVGVGIYFAWVQFNKEVVHTPKGVKNDAAESQPSHTLELSTSGVKVSSHVLGVIILTLSLAFFYLYLRYVYPITEIF